MIPYGQPLMEPKGNCKNCDKPVGFSPPHMVHEEDRCITCVALFRGKGTTSFKAELKEENKVSQPTRYYIAGPMSGIEEHNFPAFEAAENALRLQGKVVVSPREITLAGEGKGLDKPWNFYLRNDLTALLTCDAIVLLSGWKASRGARLEYTIADKLEMWVFSLNSEMQLKRQNAGYRGV